MRRDIDQPMRDLRELPDLKHLIPGQNDFKGRLLNFFKTSNPLNLLLSDEKLERAKHIIENYKRGVYDGKMTLRELYEEKSRYDSAFHPDTGEKMFVIGRMSAQVPCNMVIVGCMLTFYKKKSHIFFFHWLNQTFNAVVNYTNRSGFLRPYHDHAHIQDDMTLLKAYVAATGGALTCALGSNALIEKFKKLAITLDPPLPKNYAANTENIMKNRFDSAVPYDRNRVVLSPLIGSNIDTTYYNASQIKGYFYPYIAAQDPISEATVIDFWRMIVDQRVQTVVMLTNEEDWSVSEKYWPEDKSNEWKHGKVNVEVTIVEEEVTPFFVERTLKYTINANGGDTTTTEELVQYAFTGWPVDRPTPSTPEGVISLIGRILDRQSKLIETGPILMHCRDGSSETGIFCCISMLLLRLRAENRVDVFQTVKALQSQRAQMFTKFDQYAFCYKAVAHYISRPS